jgi:hypothetical protein
MQRIVDEVSFDSVHDGRDNGALSHKPAFVHDLPQMHLKQTRDKTTVREAEYISQSYLRNITSARISNRYVHITSGAKHTQPFTSPINYCPFKI